MKSPGRRESRYRQEWKVEAATDHRWKHFEGSFEGPSVRTWCKEHSRCMECKISSRVNYAHVHAKDAIL
jgi:hypothetical protein